MRNPGGVVLIFAAFLLTSCSDGRRTAEDEECEPQCGDRECGDDGCGGSCGGCAEDQFCNAQFLCEVEPCEPSCGDRECGEDGCGGSCGECDAAEVCDENFQCICIPDCMDRCCGDDGCGGTCPDSCGDETECDPDICNCVPISECGTEVDFPTCTETSTAPVARDEIQAFVSETALPLKCVQSDGEHWDFASLEEDSQGAVVFMFGEVHYSNELGPTSEAVFENMVRRGEVNTLALEFGMDATEAMNAFIQTGGGQLFTEFYVDFYPPNMFIPVLLHRARELYLEGFEIAAVGVDIPEQLSWVNEEIEFIANRLGAEGRSLALDTMPWVPPDPMAEVSNRLLAEIEAYYNHIQASLGTICSELSESDCERLEMLARGFWSSAFSASEAFYYAGDRELQRFFSTREPLIIYNYRNTLGSGDARVYAHMGAAHTAKWSDRWAMESCAEHLDQNLEVTAGRVYTTTPAYGDGSAIGYEGYSVEALPPDPPVVASVLQHEDVDTWYVSTRLPNDSCVGNPLEEMNDPSLMVPLGLAYDSLVFIRALSPMSMYGDHRQATPEAAVKILERRFWLRQAEFDFLRSTW